MATVENQVHTSTYLVHCMGGTSQHWSIRLLLSGQSGWLNYCSRCILKRGRYMSLITGPPILVPLATAAMHTVECRHVISSHRHGIFACCHCISTQCQRITNIATTAFPNIATSLPVQCNYAYCNQASENTLYIVPSHLCTLPPHFRTLSP